MKENKFSLKYFAVKYIIEGVSGTDPESFLQNVKHDVFDLLTKHRETKVKMILRCLISKTELNTGDEIIVRAALNSSIIVNLKRGGS